jgi:ubiquinone/menaquinone biosynthesis C-methylase UbiE
MSQSKQYWSSIAEKYDSTISETGDQSQQLIINPIVEKFLGDLTGKVVLDAGCGNGYWSRRMAKTSERVVGVDFTPELIEHAKRRGVPGNVEFLVGNLARTTFLDKSFDTVLLNMVVLDLEDLSSVIHEIGRVTKDGGNAVVSTTHPCFENPPYTQSVRDAQGKKVGRTVSYYFQTGLVEDQPNNYQHWHHTLSEYVNVFAENNLFVEKMVEPNGAEILENGEVDHFPYFLIMRLRKMNDRS